MRVEVFKTNIEDHVTASNIMEALQLFIPGSKINFDLEDCDNILRVESNQFIRVTVPAFLAQKGFFCEVLE